MKEKWKDLKKTMRHKPQLSIHLKSFLLGLKYKKTINDSNKFFFKIT